MLNDDDDAVHMYKKHLMREPLRLKGQYLAKNYDNALVCGQLNKCTQLSNCFETVLATLY